MTYDLIIGGGTLVDGLGGEPYPGDLAVSDGVITAVGTVDGVTTAVMGNCGVGVISTWRRSCRTRRCGCM